jgi:hypothetical protein
MKKAPECVERCQYALDVSMPGHECYPTCVYLRKPSASVTCAFGIHQRVLEGSGMMQDGLTCVDCGRDKYPEAFGIAVKTLPWPDMIDRSAAGRLREWAKALVATR